jgi:hypothetical protein
MWRAGHVGETRIALEYFVRKHEGKKVLEKVTVNGRIVLKETGRKSVEWNHLTQDKDQWRRFASMGMNFWIA